MTTRELTFSWHRWEYPAGTQRRNLSCDRCGYNASHAADPTAPDSAHLEASRSHECPPAQYYWDDWRREAFENGMPADVADAGRALIREAFQHGWGIEPNLGAMMRDGLRSPTRSRNRWRRMLRERQDAELGGFR